MTQQLFGWSEQTWLYLDQAGILVGNIMLVIPWVAIIVGWTKKDNIRRWISRNRFPHIGGKPEGMEWQGLVFTVSREELPGWVVKQVQPAWIGLLVTELSEATGKRIQTQTEHNGIKAISRRIENPDDPQEAYRQTLSLLEHMAAEGCNRIAVDITGGKVPMSLGAFMAAEEVGADSLYVATDFDQNRRPDMRTARITSISSN